MWLALATERRAELIYVAPRRKLQESVPALPSFSFRCGAWQHSKWQLLHYPRTQGEDTCKSVGQRPLPTPRNTYDRQEIKPCGSKPPRFGVTTEAKCSLSWLVCSYRKYWCLIQSGNMGRWQKEGIRFLAVVKAINAARCRKYPGVAKRTGDSST